jgi:hypothetical protein
MRAADADDKTPQGLGYVSGMRYRGDAVVVRGLVKRSEQRAQFPVGTLAVPQRTTRLLKA